MIAGALPALFSALFYYLDKRLGAGFSGITPPEEALIRSLPGLALFWGARWEELRHPLVLPLYGAYAGAVADERGVVGALVGLLLGVLLLPFLPLAKSHRFVAALIYVALATFVSAGALTFFGLPSGWVLPLVLSLVVLLY